MKNRLMLITMLLPFLFNVPVSAGEVQLSYAQAEDVRNNTCIPYLKALQNGDVKTIIAYSAGDMYKKYQVLLKQNPTYPKFLRDYYRGVEFRPGQIIRDGNDLIAEVLIVYPNGNQNVQKLRLSKTADNSRQWKIVGIAKNF